MREDLKAIEKNFLVLDTETSSQVIACLSIVRGSPRSEEVGRAVQTAVSRFPRARRRLVVPDLAAAWGWEEDEDFSVDNHLRFHEFPAAQSVSDLLQEASLLFSNGLDLSRPLWAFHIITAPRLDHSITLFLIHHGFSDGAGGMELFHAFCEPRRRGAAGRDSGSLRAPALRTRVPVDLRMWSSELNVLSSVRRVMSDWGVRRDDFPHHGRNSARRTLSVKNFSLDRARLIKNALDVSLNDVFLGYVSGALRRLTDGGGYLPAGRAFLPFNLRPRSERRELGNYLSAVPIPLHAGADDPLKRVLEIHHETLKLKVEGSFGAFGIFGRVAAIFPRRIQRRILLSACRRANFICTNVPSSRQQLIVGGAPIIASYGCAALLPEQGFAIGFMSYVDQVCVCLVSDPAIVPEPEKILAAISAAEEELFDRILAALPAAEHSNALHAAV